MAEKELTYSEVAEHKTKKDLYMVVHDKVYNATEFCDEHPGGEEVLLDVAGQDATDAFEDVGHSDEAREILDGLRVGTLKRSAADPVPSSNTAPASSKTATSSASSSSTGMGIGLYAAILVGGALAYGAYVYVAGQDKK